jgi:sugar lactone lactonase YvrE
LDSLSTPNDIAIDSKQNWFVADTGKQRITKYYFNDSLPSITFLTGSAFSLFIDRFDNIYFSTPVNVEMFNVTTRLVERIAGNDVQGSELNQLSNPRGIYVDQNGTVYVADSDNNRVVKWVSGATQGVVVAGGNESDNTDSALNNPCGIYVDEVLEPGTLYICDYGNNRIQKWYAGATNGTTVATPVNPWSIIVDTHGIMYISQKYTYNEYYLYSQIVKWDQDTDAGQIIAGGLQSFLNDPKGFKFDKDYNLWIADTSNNRVAKLLYEPESCPSDN